MTIHQVDLFGGSVDVTPPPPAPPDPREFGVSVRDDLYGIALRYVPGLDWLVSDQGKGQALARLGIERRDGESHLSAWVRAMADENRVSRRDIGDAVNFSTTPVRAFVFALA